MKFSKINKWFLASIITLSSTMALAQPYDHNRPGPMHNQYKTYNYTRIDSLIAQQDSQINEAIRRHLLTPREQRTVLANAQALKNRRNRMAADGRISPVEVRVLESQAAENERVLNRLQYNRRR